MLEDLIKDEIQLITEQLPVTDVFELKDFINYELSDLFVDNFVKSQLRLSLYSDYMKFDILNEGHISFDFSQDSFEDYCNYMFSHSKISYNSAEELITKAVISKFDFLMRPLSALESFIYEGNVTKGAFELLLSLRRFSQFHSHILDYIIIEFESIAESDLFNTVSSSYFVNIIRGLDRQFYENKTIHEFCDYLKEIVQKLNFENDLISIYVLNEILKDKSLYYVIDRLNERYTMTESIALADFQNFLVELHNEMTSGILVDSNEFINEEYQSPADEDLLFELEEKVKEITQTQDEDFYINDMTNIDNGNDDYIIHSEDDADFSNTENKDI